MIGHLLSNPLAIPAKAGYTPTFVEWYGLVGHAYPFGKLVRLV
ncbi:MAG TPA: hypothetical protein P5227_08445 [Emcibacteraceae bacterium]|nr:hypothetical protein [Emcibacteraceae bacterium]HRW30012.1 hypothetical protein [Emcibacteraceae bacterium]